MRAHIETYRDYLTLLYCNMTAGKERVAILEKLNALNCWGDAK